MAISKGGRWIIGVCFLAILSGGAGWLLRLDPLAELLTELPICVLGLLLAAHLFLGWIPRWQRYFFRVGKALLIPLLLLVSFTVTDLHFWYRDRDIARRYVAGIAPALENYHRVSGCYPDALSKITSAPPMPYRLTYEIDRGGDGYDFQFDACCIYSSQTGEWFDDD